MESMRDLVTLIARAQTPEGRRWLTLALIRARDRLQAERRREVYDREAEARVLGEFNLYNG